MAHQTLVTTNHIIGETWTFLRRKVGHPIATSFLDATEAAALGRLVIVRVSAEQEGAAWDWLRRHDERAYSFVDACSFAVMRSMRIRDALSFDGDFTAAGFRELRASE